MSQSRGGDPGQGSSGSGGSTRGSGEFSILDIPGIECEVVQDEPQQEASGDLPEHLAYLLDQSTSSANAGSADEDDPMSVVASSSEADVRGEKSKSQGEEEEDEEVAQFKRRKELTDKYIAGQVSFSEFVREIHPDSDEDDEDEVYAGGATINRKRGSTASSRGGGAAAQGGDESTADEEWQPPMPKSRRSSKASSNAAAASPKEGAAVGGEGEEDEVEEDEEEVGEEHKLKFEAELDQTQRQQLGKKRRKVGAGVRRKRLDPALQGLMGEANLRYARGDRDMAVRMCMEVIRQDPSAPEPFQTLSTLYEDSGEQDKSLQFAMLAAHLAPQDAEEWARLADMSLELEDLHQAAACYRKAIDADVDGENVVRYHLARCKLLERVGDARAALRGFRRLLEVLKPDQGADYLHASKEIARLLHERDDIEAAKNALRDAVNRYPDAVDSADINLLLELLIVLGQNEEALEVLCQHAGVKFVSETLTREGAEELQPEQQLEAFSQVVFTGEQEVPLEIRTKLLVVLINVRAAHLIGDFSEELLAHDPDDFGDLMLEVAEALMTGEFYKEALPFLAKLVYSQNYSQAEVWLKHGECLMATGNVEEAEAAYQNVVALAPNHLDARRTLSSILHRLGRPEEALHTLTQDEEAELLDPTLLYERCQLLLAEGCEDEFVSKSQLLFSRHLVNIRNREELHAVASAKKLSSKSRALQEVRNYRREPLSDAPAGGAAFEQQASEIPVMEEFELFRRLCSFLHDRGRFGELQRLTFSALGSPHFNKKPELARECEFLCLLSSFLNGDSYHAYNLVRELVVKDVQNSKMWNLFNLVIMRADDVRHNRFLMRLMSKNSDNLALGILNGHNCLVAGTYKYSLGEYMSAFKQEPKNPLVALMLGLTFTHMACQKFSAKKHSLVVQACAFLNQYLQLRGRCQESYYNLGRAMHQLGLLPAAVHYYKKALALEPVVSSDGGGSNIFDLRRETAFNLSLVYQSSGAHRLSRMYIQRYIVV